MPDERAPNAEAREAHLPARVVVEARERAASAAKLRDTTKDAGAWKHYHSEAKFLDSLADALEARLSEQDQLREAFRQMADLAAAAIEDVAETCDCDDHEAQIPFYWKRHAEAQALAGGGGAVCQSSASAEAASTNPANSGGGAT
jgi:hypothetical protein